MASALRRRERGIGLLILGLLLVPPALLARRIDREADYVTFLRWIDDQAGIERGAWGDPFRTESEAALYREVARTADAIAPDFHERSIKGRWRVLQEPEMRQVFDSFQQLRNEKRVRVQGVEIDWTNTDVSGNVGALLIGFRHAVADLMWLQVSASWENGLINRMLPLMKTVVRLDPQFLEAYSLGAWHLAYNISAMQNTAAEKRKYVDEAIDFVVEGLRKNPRSAQLYESLGFRIHFLKLEDYDQAQYYLTQGIQFEPHEPRMEREAGLALERLRREQDALDIMEAFDKKHPTWKMQKVHIERLTEKLRARRLEREGRLEEALALWEQLDSHTRSEPVAPLEVLRLTSLIKARQLETTGQIADARAEVVRLRNVLPEMFRPDIEREIARLTEQLEGAAQAA